MSHVRMLDPNSQPSGGEILAWVGAQGKLWSALRDYLALNYDHSTEVRFGGKKYGWCIRYRKGGRTLVTLYPERDEFTVLIVLGKKEVAKIEAILEDLSPAIRELFERTEQLHDGRWLWIRPSSDFDLSSVRALLGAKRRPKSTASEQLS